MMEYLKKAIEELSKTNELQEFLKVSAPDRNEGNLYYNKEGKGLLETFSDNSKISKHQKGDKLFFTNEKGEIFNVATIEPYILTNQKRLAEEENDFKEIFHREFLKSGLKNTLEEQEYFKYKVLPGIVKGLMKKHKKHVGITKIQAPITFLAERFLKFLQKESISEQQKETPVSLESLFIDKSQYPVIMKYLEKDGSIIRLGETYSINKRLLEENKLSEKRAICALGYLLMINHYLRGEDTQLANALSSLFNIRIDKGTYSRAKTQCFIIGKDIAHDYFALFPRLKKS